MTNVVTLRDEHSANCEVMVRVEAPTGSQLVKVRVAEVWKTLVAALNSPDIDWTTPLGERVREEINLSLYLSSRPDLCGGASEGAFDLVVALGRLDTIAPGFVDLPRTMTCVSRDEQ